MKTYTISDKEFKENSKKSLEENKEKLIKIIFKEIEIKEKKENIINEINYWKDMVK